MRGLWRCSRATELKKWRDGLLGTMAPSTINRLCGCLCAALEQAAQHDKRIQNRDDWETGLAGLPNAQEVRNVIISDDKVRELVAAAYAHRSSVWTADRYAWRSLAHVRAKPSASASRICTITRCDRR